MRFVIQSIPIRLKKPFNDHHYTFIAVNPQNKYRFMKTMGWCLGMMLWLSSTLAQGQARKNSLQISGGPQYGRIQDRHAAPMTYDIRGPMFDLRLTHRSKTIFWETGLSATLGQTRPNDLSTKLDLHWEDDFEGNPIIAHVGYDAPYYNATFSFHIRKPIATVSQANVWLGGGLVSSMTYTEISRYFWPLFSNAVTISASIDRQIGNHQVQVDLNSFAAGLVSRFDYASNPTLPDKTLANSFLRNDTRFRDISNFRNINVRLSYSYPLTKRLSAGLVYEFRWTDTKEPRPLRAY